MTRSSRYAPNSRARSVTPGPSVVDEFSQHDFGMGLVQSAGGRKGARSLGSCLQCSLFTVVTCVPDRRIEAPVCTLAAQCSQIGGRCWRVRQTEGHCDRIGSQHGHSPGLERDLRGGDGLPRRGVGGLRAAPAALEGGCLLEDLTRRMSNSSFRDLVDADSEVLGAGPVDNSGSDSRQRTARPRPLEYRRPSRSRVHRQQDTVPMPTLIRAWRSSLPIGTDSSAVASAFSRHWSSPPASNPHVDSYIANRGAKDPFRVASGSLARSW